MSYVNIFENKKQKEIKREFSLEKITTAIQCGNMISSIRNKYIDPKIIHHKNLSPKIKLKKKLEFFEPNDPYGLNKMLIHELLKKKQTHKSVIKIEEEKSISTKNNLSNEIFPKIQSQSEKKEKLKKNKFSDPLLITSGMFKGKNFYKDPSQKIKLYNIFNKKSRNRFNIQNIYPKIDDIKKLNEKYNIQLNLNYLNRNYMTLKKPIKMNKKGLIYYLFKKYVTASPNEMSMTNKNKSKKKKSLLSTKSRNSQNNINMPNIAISNDSENNSIDLFQKEFLNEDKNIFLTKYDKLDNEKDEKKEIEIDNRNKKGIKFKNLKLFENNKNIINYNQKIYIDCLLSHVNSKLQNNKLFYKYINKTTFELQKDPLYKKVKKFETKIDELVKTQ